MDRESFDRPVPETEFRGSRAVQGRQGRGAVRAAEHEWRAHRRSAASGAVPIKLKVAKGTAVHAPVALVRLPLLLQHHAPPFCAGVLEPDLQHPFWQASFLRELLQILGVRIVIDREVTLHRPQLVVFKTRSHPFCSAVGTRYAGSSRAPPTEGHIYVVRVQIYIGGHSFEILRFPLPGPALLSRRRDDSGTIEVGYLGW